jgi:hypothetical protein
VRLGEPLSVAPGRETDGLRAWVALLEATVRRHPTQWFNFFDVWNPWGGAAPSGAPTRPTFV